MLGYTVTGLVMGLTLAQTPPTQRPIDVDAEAQVVLVLVNKLRKENHLNPLVLHPLLKKAATWFAKDMADKDYWTKSHVDSLGRTPDKRIEWAGYDNWMAIAENIAGGATDGKDVFKMWLKSPHHKENMLNSHVTEMGLGYGFNPKSKYQRYWVQDFAAPLPPGAVPDDGPKTSKLFE